MRGAGRHLALTGGNFAPCLTARPGIAVSGARRGARRNCATSRARVSRRVFAIVRGVHDEDEPFRRAAPLPILAQRARNAVDEGTARKWYRVRLMQIRESWRRIDAVLKEHAPQAFTNLAGPASVEELRELATLLGRALPEELAESLRVHNGQRGLYMSSPFVDHQWLLDNDRRRRSA